jgi:deoxyribodipyrimidine photolyase-related protein
MPALASANQLEASRALPEFYWTDETELDCLAKTIGGVSDRGYSHHIQRLMVLANFATLWGVEPRALNDRFHATYVNAYHWVTTPNVIEIGQYGHGVFATKPYVSSATYVDRMSDHCADCRYDPSADTGEDACPFNAPLLGLSRPERRAHAEQPPNGADVRPRRRQARVGGDG